MTAAIRKRAYFDEIGIAVCIMVHDQFSAGRWDAMLSISQGCQWVPNNSGDNYLSGPCALQGVCMVADASVISAAGDAR